MLLDQDQPSGTPRVAIPIVAVEGVSDGVRLEGTNDQVRDLPPGDLEDPE